MNPCGSGPEFVKEDNMTGRIVRYYCQRIFYIGSEDDGNDSPMERGLSLRKYADFHLMNNPDKKIATNEMHDYEDKVCTRRRNGL